jgi:hypothetical protein
MKIPYINLYLDKLSSFKRCLALFFLPTHGAKFYGVDGHIAILSQQEH